MRAPTLYERAAWLWFRAWNGRAGDELMSAAATGLILAVLIAAVLGLAALALRAAGM
jgi:hypothetical protein